MAHTVINVVIYTKHFYSSSKPFNFNIFIDVFIHQAPLGWISSPAQKDYTLKKKNRNNNNKNYQKFHFQVEWLDRKDL